MRQRGAVSADFLHYYGVPFRDAVKTWPGRDLTDAIRHLPADSATARAELGDLWDWNHFAANMAELVDLMTYWLQSEYAKWTHDPDDPDTKRREAERKRSGIKPPPVPLIPPVAHRPPTVREQYERTYLELVAEHGAAREPTKRLVSLDEWERAAGL